MLYAIISQDVPDSAPLRKRARPEHLARLETLRDEGRLIIAGPHPAIDAPYKIAHARARSLGSDSPLRQGAYRCLAATANNFARESLLDELASAAATDPLDFRMAHLQDARMRTVLNAAAEKFDWNSRRKRVTPELGVGLACGTEKGSVVAACVEVAIDRAKGKVVVNEVCESFEGGAIQNPENLVSQVQGCIMMGIGPALFEAVRFADGKVLTNSFAQYRVPRLKDMPKIDVQLVDNREIPSTGAGETPLIAVAPAIANAIFAATDQRIRSMPIKLPGDIPG